MRPNLLVLGGTTEATALCRRLAEAGISGIFSLAGRVERPLRQPLPMRVGGFGGAAGLVAYLRAERISHVVDATHPFAAQMSAHAVAACAEAGVPLVALTRPAWEPGPGDRWTRAADIPGAVAALDRPACRVMLAVGRMHLAAFAAHPRHFYLLRLVDPPGAPLPFPDCQVVVDRGPFTEAGDLALLREHRIGLVVSKNSGGTGAASKLAAARTLGLEVIVIDRPALPQRREFSEIDAVMHWIAHAPTDLGV